LLYAMHPMYMMARTKETTGPQELAKNIMVFKKFSLGTSNDLSSDNMNIFFWNGNIQAY